MLNWKGCRREWLRPLFKVLFQHMPGGTVEKHENTTGEPVSKL
jgi:hypothetical protein